MDKYSGSWSRRLHGWRFADRGPFRCDRGQREVAGEFSVSDSEGVVFEALPFLGIFRSRSAQWQRTSVSGLSLRVGSSFRVACSPHLGV